MSKRSRHRAGHSTRSRPPVWVIIYSAIVGAGLAVPMLLTAVMIPWTSDFVPSARLLGIAEWAAPFCAVLTFLVAVTVNKVRVVAGKSPMPGPGSTKWLLVVLASPFFGYFVCDAFITRAIGYVLHVASPAHEADIALSVSSAPDFTIRRCGYSARLEPDNWLLSRRVCHLPLEFSERLRHGGWLRVRAMTSPYGLQVLRLEDAGTLRKEGAPFRRRGQ